VSDRLANVLRSLDGQQERWLWVEGVAKPYVCDTHDDLAHFAARALEFNEKVKMEVFPKRPKEVA